MAHLRTQIRDAAVMALTGLPTTGPRVFPGRSRPAAKDSDPHLLVYCIEESASPTSMGVDPVFLRELNLRIEGRVIASSAAEVEEQLDRIALEVEPAITRDSSLGGRVLSVMLARTRIAVESPGERHAGEVTMEFTVQYRTRESSPDKPA